MAPVWPKPHPNVWPPPVHAIVLGAVGVAAVGVGIGFAVEAGAKNDAIAAAPRGVCGPAVSSSPACIAAHDSLDARDTARGISYGFLIGGGVALAAAGATWALFPRQRTDEKNGGIRAVPTVGPGTAGIHFTGSF